MTKRVTAEEQIRLAVQRLMTAMRRVPEIDVTVKRADLELLLATWQHKPEKP